MNANKHRFSRGGAESGFTTAEVLVASFITVLIAAGVLTCFLWCAEQSALSVKIAWSQNEAMRSAGKLTDYVRNASAIHSIDVTNGCWVRLTQTNGAVIRIVYSNGVDHLRDGRMYLYRTNGTEMIVARGMTGIMGTNGYTQPVFSMNPSSNILQLAYRVSEPASTGGRDADDDDFAVCIRFGIYLRNVAQ